MIELPTYCYFCHAYLMGGATRHKPGCEMLRIIDEAFVKTAEDEPPKEADAPAD